jgi:mono/diheme cytochrome c family protein
MNVPGGAKIGQMNVRTLRNIIYALHAPAPRAPISTGIDNEGQPLNPVMPHWKLSPQDLHDVAEYVLTQLK